ncbi:MAG: hypothetical protein N2D54_01555, partial [Chloroflexota bacterium]
MMLTTIEKTVFILAAIAAVYAGIGVAIRIAKVIGRGKGEVDWSVVPGRLVSVIVKTTALTPVWRMRFLASFLHALVAWAFMFYLFVNIGEVFEVLITGYIFLGEGSLSNIYRLLADVLSVSALIGMA